MPKPRKWARQVEQETMGEVEWFFFTPKYIIYFWTFKCNFYIVKIGFERLKISFENEKSETPQHALRILD